jgi:3,4-dihydroxy 2-butanone 4-phosphate synthase/GTP cyclohydrolase II
MRRIAESEGGGAVIYLRNQEGRGIGLWNKLEAYALQDGGMDTLDANLELGFSADERHYQDAAAILRMKGISRIRLLTNNPSKMAELAAFNIEVADRVPIEAEPLPENRDYLRTKRDRFHHQLGNV